MSQRRTWQVEALVIAALMLLPLLFWWQLWSPDPAVRSTIPAGDFTEQYYPLQLFAAREMASGQLPAWNPYINAGQPGLADTQTGFFYPPNLLLNLVLSLLGLPFTPGTLTVLVVLHFSLASLFDYLFVRHVVLRSGARHAAARFAGVVSALCFTYGGYLTSFPVQQVTILETAIWLPLVLLFLDRAFHRPRPGSQLILSGAALACAILAGHPQTAMYVVYATLAYGLFMIWSTRSVQNATPVSSVGAHLLQLLLVLAVGTGLAAIQLVPSLGFIARSTRADLNYDAVAWGFPLAEITHLLYPGYFGGSSQYVGILPLVLSVAALNVRKARREVVFWMILGATAFLLSFGGHTFLYNVSYLLTPGFGAVRNQERIIYLFGFATSVLAGYGALVLVQPLTKVTRKGFRRFVRGLGWVWSAFLVLTALWYYGYLQGQQQGVEVNLFAGLLRHHVLILLILGGSVVLFALRLRGRSQRRWWIALALFLVWLNLFTVNWRFNLAALPEEGFYPNTELISFLQEQPGIFRISSAGLLPGGASAGIVYELEDITGNTPLRTDAFQQFEDRVGSWRRWQLLNVRYVISQRDIDGPGLERVYEEGKAKVYRMGDPLPRAWIVHRTVTAADDQAFDLLNEEGFDPRMMAVLPPGGMTISLPGSDSLGSVAKVVEAGPGRLVVEVSTTQDGLLVISQPFYPGWRAHIDGAKAPMVRVDTLLQGVPIQSGEHRVNLKYRTSSLPAFASLVVLIGCLAMLWIHRRI